MILCSEFSLCWNQEDSERNLAEIFRSLILNYFSTRHFLCFKFQIRSEYLFSLRYFSFFFFQQSAFASTLWQIVTGKLIVVFHNYMQNMVVSYTVVTQTSESFLFQKCRPPQLELSVISTSGSRVVVAQRDNHQWGAGADRPQHHPMEGSGTATN